MSLYRGGMPASIFSNPRSELLVDIIHLHIGKPENPQFNEFLTHTQLDHAFQSALHHEAPLAQIHFNSSMLDRNHLSHRRGFTNHYLSRYWAIDQNTLLPTFCESFA